MNKANHWGSPHFRSATLLVAACLLVLAIYSASIPKQFTNWDDPKYILNNPLIQTFSLHNLQAMFSKPYFGNYAPVTLFSYALDVKLWGKDANAFHVHNLILHLASVVVLYILLSQLGVGAWPRRLAVLAFAIHPTNVESISWASERKNLLAGLFFLLSFRYYVFYSRQRNRSAYLLSLLFFMVSVLSKAGTIVAPLVFIAFDYFWEGKKGRELRWAEKAPFFVLTALQAYLSIKAASTGGMLHSYYQSTFWLGVLDSGRLVGQYLLLIFWPNELTPLMTPKLAPSVWDPRVIVPFLVMIGVLAVWLRFYRRSFFWVAFFVLLLAPVMNIVPLPVAMACRYLYLAQIGVWVLVGILLARLADRLKDRVWWRPAVSVALLIWVALLTFQAYTWAGAWRSSITLWEDAVRKDPMNLVARANLGQAYFEKRRNEDAARQFLTVLSVQRDNVLALAGLATCSLAEGRVKAAEQYAAQACQSSPDYALAFRLLGRARLLQRDLSNARTALLRAYELNPADNGSLEDLVSVYELSTKPLDGAFLAELMIRNSPQTFEGYWARGRLLMAGQRYRDAIPALDTALALSRDTLPPQDSQRIAQALANCRQNAGGDPNVAH